jgi:hypothetical protein
MSKVDNSKIRKFPKITFSSSVRLPSQSVISARPFVFPHGTTQVLSEIIVELHIGDFYKKI